MSTKENQATAIVTVWKNMGWSEGEILAALVVQEVDGIWREGVPSWVAKSATAAAKRGCRDYEKAELTAKDTLRRIGHADRFGGEVAP